MIWCAWCQQHPCVVYIITVALVTWLFGRSAESMAYRRGRYDGARFGEMPEDKRR